MRAILGSKKILAAGHTVHARVALELHPHILPWTLGEFA